MWITSAVQRRRFYFSLHANCLTAFLFITYKSPQKLCNIDQFISASDQLTPAIGTYIVQNKINASLNNL